MPHLPLPSPSPALGRMVLEDGVVAVAFLPDFLGCGTSKTWRVALSEVQARRAPEGLKEREKIVAGSMPRRSSATRAQLLVAWTRMIVPLTISELRR